MGVDDSHNGSAMWRSLNAMKNLPFRLEDSRNHDRELESMRDNFLIDGCTADDYAAKVNKLINRDHLRFLERPQLSPALLLAFFTFDLCQRLTPRRAPPLYVS